MNLRLVTFLCCGATLGLLQGGCASTPTTTDTDMRPVMHGLGDKPQMAFPGATRNEVKALAMGSAKSRAWTIVNSTDDQMVVQRRLDPSSAAADRLAASGVPSTGLIEVTSYFVDARGGAKVALEAAVVSGGPGPTGTRSDVTEAFRPSLMESLESLHASWTKNRARIARAAPPTGSAPEAAASDLDGDSGVDDDTGLDGGAGSASPAGATAAAVPRTPTQTAWADEPASSGLEPLPARIQPTAAPPLAGSSTANPVMANPAPSRPVAIEPEPIVVATQYPQQSTPTTLGVGAGSTRAPEPRRSVGGPAPVVDASRRRVSAPSGAAVSQPMTLPGSVPNLPPVVAPLPVADTMMTLPSSANTVSWSYYAEQYARLRGCQVTPQGAILIDTRTDGEIHKVPCEGADSLLVQCQNGECRGLL